MNEIRAGNEVRPAEIRDPGVSVSASEVEDIRRHFRWDANVSEGLALFRPYLGVCMPKALDAFYEHALSQPETAAIIGDPGRIAGLKKKQSVHWDLLFGCDLCEEYLESAITVARIHSRIGLKPLWYLGGYNLFSEYLFAAAVDAYRRDPDKLKKVLRAINTVVTLDLNLVLDVYQEDIKKRGTDALAASASKFDDRVGGRIRDMSGSISELMQMARGLTQVAAATQEKCATVSASTEEASTNVETVASASEELNASIGEISRQVQSAAELSETAVHVSNQSNDRLASLEETSNSIGEVTKLIMDIAAQTNLLALNATIEAARAGEAGKGFAVVASEVKALSNRTQQATSEIQGQVASIREATAGAIDAIREVGAKINEINDAVTAVAAAAEEQSAATTEISRSVTEASAGTRDVAMNMEGVRSDASETDQAASSLSAHVGHMEEQADQLQALANGFVEEIRATKIE